MGKLVVDWGGGEKSEDALHQWPKYSDLGPQ
jgi:hypothetical protein